MKLELLKSSLWLGFKVLTTRKVTYTRCPRCRGLIRPLGAKSEQKYPSSCPHCGGKVETDDSVNSHLALKFLGAGFILSIVGLVVLSCIDKGEPQVFSHLATAIGAYIAATLKNTVAPPV